MVEGVEGFETELQPDSFGESYVLDERDVPDLQSWSINRAYRGRAEVAYCVGKGRRVEELRSRFMATAIGDLIGADLNRAAGSGHAQTAGIERTGSCRR